MPRSGAKKSGGGMRGGRGGGRAAAVSDAAGLAAAGAAVELAYIGIGLTVIGSAFGIGRLAASAFEGMSRQPEMAGQLQTAMIIAAALIEGFTFYALFLCTPS